eukprot:UN07931
MIFSIFMDHNDKMNLPSVAFPTDN